MPFPGMKKKPKDEQQLTQNSKTKNSNTSNNNNDDYNNPYLMQQQQLTTPSSSQLNTNNHNNNNTLSNNNNNSTNGGSTIPNLIFHCQLAHGSPNGLISGFTNVKELYQKIADCFDINVKDILFCTLNTHKIDMNKLLGGQIGLDDFIFAHIKGNLKQIEVTKSEPALGLTITDNGAGYAFIKRIKEGSVIDRIDDIKVGDHIEQINDVNLIGARHFEVAKMLKDIPVGAKFRLKLVEPTREGFLNISSRSSKQTTNQTKAVGTGKQTMRMKSGKVEEKSDVVDLAISKINNLLESFMGIHDSELAQTIWELGEVYTNPSDFAKKVENSEIGQFQFSEDFTFDLWGAINDAKQGRLN